MEQSEHRKRWSVVALCASLLFLSPIASAVPSFARQTGFQCFECHTVFPELTPLGRQFKLTGYTMSANTQGQTKRLQEDWLPPLSLMVQVSETFTGKKQPESQNGNVLFPDEMSLLYAGRISDKAGTFTHLTYDGVEDHFSLDNTDIRFASEGATSGGTPYVYGLTLNNSPAVQDLWNSTPVWGYPYASSGVAPEPVGGTLLEERLGQQVAGLGAYGWWNRRTYAELTFYRASQIGQEQPPGPTSTDTVDGNAPYWRLAYEHTWGTHYLEVGTYGMWADIFPIGVTGPTDRFRDVALDAQYQHISNDRTLTVHTTLIHEKQTLDASLAGGTAAHGSNSLQTFRADAIYYWQRTYGLALAYFSTTGDSDSLRYAPEAVRGSRTGKPDTIGWIAELDYLPWENTKFALQYVFYDKFNGARSNYDGFGRDASDNDTLYLNAWLNL